VKVREPVARPLDVVVVELLLSASQAYVSGVLMYLALGLWSDRGVGFASVAVILVVLSLAVGAAWLFWLLGGTGWPLAAANVPVAMFTGFALVLGTQGSGLIRLDPVPLLLLIAASVYGLIGGVFLDSPRRWRWDQRQTLRPGTEVPRVSPTTMALAARIPRSLPTRSTGTEPGWPEPPATGASPAGDRTGQDIGGAGEGRLGAAIEPGAETPRPGSEATTPVIESLPYAVEKGSPGTTPTDASAEKPDGMAATVEPAAAPQEDKGATLRDPGSPVELPTSIEPRPQLSPWAWAAPPEWNRDDDDDQPGSRTARGS
jgi:hypothetical protein